MGTVLANYQVVINLASKIYFVYEACKSDYYISVTVSCPVHVYMLSWYSVILKVLLLQH